MMEGEQQVGEMMEGEQQLGEMMEGDLICGITFPPQKHDGGLGGPPGKVREIGV